MGPNFTHKEQEKKLYLDFLLPYRFKILSLALFMRSRQFVYFNLLYFLHEDIFLIKNNTEHKKQNAAFMVK